MHCLKKISKSTQMLLPFQKEQQKPKSAVPFEKGTAKTLKCCSNAQVLFLLKRNNKNTQVLFLLKRNSKNTQVLFLLKRNSKNAKVLFLLKRNNKNAKVLFLFEKEQQKRKSVVPF